MSRGVGCASSGCGASMPFTPDAWRPFIHAHGTEQSLYTPDDAEAQYYLCLLVHPDGSADQGKRSRAGLTAPDVDERLLALCHQTTARVERIALGGGRDGGKDGGRDGAWRNGLPGAALDLGRCGADEARQVALELHTRLRREGWRVVAAGIGPALTIAELAVLATLASADKTGTTGTTDETREAEPADVNVCRITPALVEMWLRCQPVRLLARLDPTRALPLAIVERLERYGLRTLGQVARLAARDPQALRRHFGAVAGAQLAALCVGRDLRALQPAVIPASVSVRLRLSADGAAGADGMGADQALAALPSLAQRLERRLEAQGQGGQRGRDLRLLITWETGGATQARRRLARPLWRRDELAEATRALLISQFTPQFSPQCAMAGQHDDHTGGDEPASPRIIALTLALGDLSPRPQARPIHLFDAGDTPARECVDGQERRERLDRMERMERLMVEVSAPLTRRYGAPALYRLEAARPDAILPEERLRLVRFDGLRNSESADPEQGNPSRVAMSMRPERPMRPMRRAAPGASDTQAGDVQAGAGVTPPQPHWW